MRFCLQPSLGTLFILIACIQLFGTYIFLKGFLLTRQTLDVRGHARTPWDQFPLSSPSPVPLLPVIQPGKPFRRAIIIVVDALRFDFALSSNTTDRHYLNKLPVIQHLLDTQAKSSLLFQFRADPPTTTMQRVKGLMTGSLPTFIDAGSNFASSAVQEDHLLHHIKQRYNSIYFMGDDTWIHLYPQAFDVPHRTFGSDSFKMLDLDSVDNNILSHLWPLVENEESDWNFTIAHFLGVDHCGHTHGPSHPNMARKLSQMNTVIERLLTQVDNSTLLVLLGDHGMSTEGDHGGESLEELMSTLFIHSRRPLVQDNAYYQQLYTRIHEARAKRLQYDLESISKRLDYDATQYPIVAQIHLVPTLAYLLQIPIPFGNLGAILPNVLVPEGAAENRMRSLLHMVGQFRMNALQVHDYLVYYAQATHQLEFSTVHLDHLLKHLYHADDIMFELASQPEFIQSISDPSIENDRFQDALEQALFEYDVFLINTIKYCESIWARFDVGSMALGILLFGLGVCVSVWSMNSIYRATVRPVLLILPSLVVSAAASRYRSFFEKMGALDWIGVLVVFSAGLVILSVFERGWRVFLSWEAAFLLIGLVQSLTLGSNSYVVWEDSVTKYTLSTLLLVWLLKKCSLTIQSIKAPLLLMIAVRLSSMTGQCREEQFPYCQSGHDDYLSFDGQLQTLFSLGFFAVILLLTVYLSRVLKEKLGKNSLLVKSVYQLCSTVVIIRIIQEMYQNTHEMIITSAAAKVLNVYLPRLVYILCSLCTAYVSSQAPYTRSQRGWSLLFLWSTILAMLQRPLASVIILGSPWVIHLLSDGDDSTLLLRLAILQYYGHHLFFVTGHQATFTSLPWKAAFVGFDEMSYYGGMMLVILSTLSGYLISWLGWLILLPPKTKAKQPLYILMLMQGIPTFMCAIFVFVLRRHLMTWKIFAPRFLFQILLNAGAHLVALILGRNL